MLGGTDTMLLYGAGSTVGPDSTYAAGGNTLLLEQAALASAPAVAPTSAARRPR